MRGQGEREQPIIVPLIVGVVVVRVEPPPVVVAVRIEDVRIAVGIVRNSIRATAL